MVCRAPQSATDKTRRRSYRRKTTWGSNVVTVDETHPPDEVKRYVAEVAGRLHKRLVEVAADIRGYLDGHIPELRRDARVVEMLGVSIEGNVDTMLHALRYDIPVKRVEAPTAALEYARRVAQHGAPINALVRAYRLGQRRINELIFAELRATDIPGSVRVAVIEAMSASIFEYIDWISQQVVVVYEDERERWLENQSSLRGVRVREILATTKNIDVDAATTAIRYPLHWHHLALVMWYPDQGDDDEVPRLQRFLRDLGDAAGTDGIPLFVAADRSCAWGWLPFRAAPAEDPVEKVRQFASSQSDPPSVTIGTLAPGIDGFRRSHREAEDARGVAIVRERRSPTVIAASDPGLSVVARLSGDVAGSREWVAGVLGDLASDDENDARLRDTLRVFLNCGSSYKTAAEELNMHFNTVKYRVGRAVARRGRDIEGDRLEVELALLACHWYGSAVLKQRRK